MAKTANSKHTSKLTLTRWHLVADRLNSKIKELEGQAMGVINSTQITAFQGKEQVRQLDEQQKMAMGKIAMIRGLLQTVGHIRSLVAEANARVGVTQKLAALEALNREVRLLSGLTQVENNTKINRDFLETYFENLGKTGSNDPSRFLRHSGGAEVKMLSEAEQEKFRAEKEALQSKAHALSDEINTLNKELLSIEIDADSARFAGLV